MLKFKSFNKYIKKKKKRFHSAVWKDVSEFYLHLQLFISIQYNPSKQLSIKNFVHVSSSRVSGTPGT